MAANVGMNIHGGAYNFGYATGDAGGHSRVESGNGGTVSGSYSYVDPNGDLRTVQYTAGPQGFQAAGDTGVDRKTAAAAAALAAMAPKAPIAGPQMHAPAPVQSWSAPAQSWYAPAPQYAPVPNVIMSGGGYSAKW